MIGERWERIVSSKGSAVALWQADGSCGTTFAELDQAARSASPSHCSRLGPFFAAQGDGRRVAIALLAGFLQGVPVQIVEKDRSRRIPTCAVLEGTALIKQTVGGSGKRRCQFFSASQVLADVDRLHAAMNLKECEVAVAALSVAHSFGLTTTVLQMLFHGLPMHWLPTPFPLGMTEAFGRHERIFLPGVPAMWKAWLLAGLDLSRVRLAVSAGSPLTLELEQRVRDAHQLKLHNLYGTSECGAVSYDAGEEPRLNASDMGAPLSGVVVREEADGVLTVNSDAVGLGYDETLAGEVFGNGHLRTCDRIQIVEGRLQFVESVGGGINVASRKLSPQEIAAKISATTGLLDVEIHGRRSRDPERVQDVVATLGVPPEALTSELRAQACSLLANWEVPRQWRVRTLPEG